NITGDGGDASDVCVRWKAVFKSAGNPTLKPCVPYLFCLQWALWLATCQLKVIQDIQVGLSERLSDGQSSEALSSLQTASTMPAPRALVALTHLLSGFCLSRPQMALQCYRKALETDSRCVCALYQSMLIYRQQGNTQAEIQALRLLHKVSNTHRQSIYEYEIDMYLSIVCRVWLQKLPKMLAEAHTLPKLPDLYLEAGAALLIDQRPADCMALCNEVISMTMELLPENVVLEEPEEKNEPETGALSDDKVATLLWTAAAYFLQGHCHTHLKDWKQATINQMLKTYSPFQMYQPAGQSVLKGLSLAGRGVSFTQMDKLKEALRDLQLSLHTFPDCVGSGLWCGEVLWRLSRRQEAAACWKKTWSIRPQSLDDRVPVYLHELQIGASLDSSELRHRIQELGLA
uniref:FA complementation group G n=1 Tax=Salarias fasciatus TaxID=181472 RepID=A0A672IAV9_SALFA